MTLDIKLELDKLRTLYQDDPRTNSFKVLVYGGTGSGKTFSLKTARKPVLIHSFDPGGSKSISDAVQKGDVIVDSRYEVEDPSKPTAFVAWDKEYERLTKLKVFDSIGTFVIDSITTWAQAALNEVMKRDSKGSRAGGTPHQNDWYPQMVILENAIKDILTLPCDVILIGHDASSKDDVTGKIYKDVMLTGKLTRRVPLLFDEVYYAMTKETSKGTEYYFQTQKDSTYQARSRYSRGKFLEKFEPQDFKKIMKKVGLPTEDKPIFME